MLLLSKFAGKALCDFFKCFGKFALAAIANHGGNRRNAFFCF